MNQPNALDRPDTSLELSAEQFTRLVQAALAHLAPFLDTLAEQPASDLGGVAEAARAVAEPLPASGQPAEQVLAELFRRSVPPGVNSAGPGHLGYIPGGGIPHAAVADLVAGVINRYIGVWHTAPALAQLEATVVRWFCDMIGYPPQAGGFLTSGGSLASWTAVAVARQILLGDDFSRGVLYTSAQAHHCLVRAALLAGFRRDQVRQVACDDQFRIRVDRLEAALEQDRADGLRPLAIMATAGTTNTGAVDDLTVTADLAAAHNVWLHVDAAYGGFFVLTERGRQLLRGIQRADSVSLDPHKSLFLPFGTGCLLVRDREQLRTVHALRAEYIRAGPEGAEFVDFGDISPELTRPLRGLRVWLPLKMHGIEPFRRNLDEKLDLARWLADELRTVKSDRGDTLEIVAEPQLTILAFRLHRPGASEDTLDLLNQQLLERINAGQRVFMSSTTLGGRFVIRACVLSLRTHLDRVKDCLAEIRRAMNELSGNR